MRKILALLCSSFCIQALSAELVTNGTFNSSLADWTANGAAAWNNGSGIISPVGGLAYFPYGDSGNLSSNYGVGNISKAINITSPGNYNLTFDFGYQIYVGSPQVLSNTNTLSILFGNSQIGSIQLIHPQVNEESGVITSITGDSIDIVKGSNRYTVSFPQSYGGASYFGNQASYSISSTAGIKTLEFLYDYKDIRFVIDNISLTLGLSAADTQASLNTQSRRLRSTFNSTMASSNFANMNTYDCNLFDKNNMCISAGGRYTNIDNPSSNNSAAVVTLGYKVNSNIRIGGFLDQSINNNTPTGINVSNKNPMMGAFAVWNKNADGLGYQVKLANAYQDKDVTTTRDAFGETGEAGTGKTNLNTQSYVGELSYAFNYQDSTIVRPYFAVRYTNIKQDAYTEDTSVSTPLTYAKLGDRSTTALMGVKLNHALTPRTNLTASLGLEQDINHKTDQLVASGVADLTSENFNNNIKRTRPVASAGAYYAVAKNQRLSGEVYYQQLPFQSTGSATAYFNYMIGF
jgi:uncharacterized protein YhjY with autotransporter beta-barrel domain